MVMGGGLRAQYGNLMAPVGRAPKQLTSVVPDVYPSYRRLLHPVRSAAADGPGEIRWSTIAAEHFTSIDSGVRFNDLAGWRDGRGPPFPYSAPLRGSLTEEQCIALTEALDGFTSRPDQVWYCLWEGYGWPELPAPGQGPPRVHLEHEDCLLFTGAADSQR